MKVRVTFEQTVSRTAVIEVDEDEYYGWREGRSEDALAEFLQAGRDQAKVQDELTTAAWQQSTLSRFEGFEITEAERE